MAFTYQNKFVTNQRRPQELAKNVCALVNFSQTTSLLILSLLVCSDFSELCRLCKISLPGRRTRGGKEKELVSSADNSSFHALRACK